MRFIDSAKARLDRARLYLNDRSKITRACQMGDHFLKVVVTNPRELSRIRAYTSGEPDTINWIAHYIKPGDVFFDVGANIGLYSIFAALSCRTQCRIYSFEPESQNYASLNRNVYVNSLSESIIPLCLAVTDSSYIDSFFVRGNLRAGEAIHHFGSAVDDRGEPFNPVHQQGMIGISLDQLCFSYDLEFPTHVKIDVDGQEAAVIKGASRVLGDRRLQTVLLEITETPSQMGDVKEIYDRFKQAGFSIVKKTPARSLNSGSYNVIFVRSTT